ncbi:MAG: hypothetical protein ACOY82_11740 [Pseudomonadota bacterium]
MIAQENDHPLDKASAKQWRKGSWISDFHLKNMHFDASSENYRIAPKLLRAAVDWMLKRGPVGPSNPMHPEESRRWSLSIPVMGLVCSIRR